MCKGHTFDLQPRARSRILRNKIQSGGSSPENGGQNGSSPTMHAFGGYIEKEVMQARQNMSLYNPMHYTGYACAQSALPAVTSMGLPTHAIKQEPRYTDAMRWPSSHSVSDLLASGHSPSAASLSQRQSSGSSSPNHMSPPILNQASLHHSAPDGTSFPLSASVYSPAYFMRQLYFQQHQHHGTAPFPASIMTNSGPSANPNL